MSKLQMGPPVGDGLRPQFYVRVIRAGRAPAPWTRAIHEQGRADAYQVSPLFYRSAEEAWEAGRVMLRRMGKATDDAAPD